MSEFKYACPVCGQHIKCASSQSGTVMECPTCFQKIIVPQAPAGEQTLILTGTKADSGIRPRKAPEAPANGRPQQKGIPGVLVVVIIFLCIAAAVGFVYRGTIFKPRPPTSREDKGTVGGHHTKRTTPSLVAPQASDTNWTLDLKGAIIPDSTAAGRIGGQNFICERAILQGGLLILRYGELSITINFTGANPKMLSGQTIDVVTNAASAARVISRWKEDDRPIRKAYTNGYAMILNFGEITRNRISGKIYLCLSDEQKSYVAGTFEAEIRKPRPKRQ